MDAVLNETAGVMAGPGGGPVGYVGTAGRTARLPPHTAGLSRYGEAGPRAVPAIIVPARRSIRGW
ncbi:hypothetical protein CA984_04280 [Streptosporangium minutum]|uniref:Uncharacterized protein n=2 Tax=Streptosporangium minutum TaxID=569862 RepID=A0A243RVU2_9ACTN|nr:hypothetical protein CA984_04280 [Streptosporangium minutum]